MRISLLIASLIVGLLVSEVFSSDLSYDMTPEVLSYDMTPTIDYSFAPPIFKKPNVTPPAKASLPPSRTSSSGGLKPRTKTYRTWTGPFGRVRWRTRSN